jgi:ABC-2 type transport system ATP-binding protein
MLEVVNLSVRAKEILLLKSINFQIQKGSICGIVGANGSGKTTLIKALLGLIKVDEGFVKIEGRVFKESAQLKSIGSLIERAPLYNHLTAFENLKVSAIQLKIGNSRIEQVLEIIGLQQEKNKKANNFSLGMKQRLGIGLAILHQPDILILDEPTNGLDPDGVIQVRELLFTLNQKYGATIIIASHVLSELEKLASHIVFIQNGSVSFSGTIVQFKEQGSLETSYQKYVD